MIKSVITFVFLFITKYSFCAEEYVNLENRLSNLESETAKLSRQLSHINSVNEGKHQDLYSILNKKISSIEEKLEDLRVKIERVESTSKNLKSKLSNLTDDMNYKFAKLDRAKNNEPMRDLKECIRIFERGDYNEARNSLHNYIKIANGNDKGEAYYWIGRCYMADNIYKEAGTYFLKSYKYYPGNPKAADSLLNLAISLKKLDKKNRACSILNRLEIEYPNRPDEHKELSKNEQEYLRCG